MTALAEPAGQRIRSPDHDFGGSSACTIPGIATAAALAVSPFNPALRVILMTSLPLFFGGYRSMPPGGATIAMSTPNAPLLPSAWERFATAATLVYI